MDSATGQAAAAAAAADRPAGPGLNGVQASFANMLESGLGNAFKSPTASDAADNQPFADATPRSVFATAMYFRVVAPQGLAVVADEDPASEATGQLAHGEVVEVLQVINWEQQDGGAVEPRYRVAKGWVSAFDVLGTVTLERMQVAMQEVRSRTWSEQKSSRPELRRGASMPSSPLSTVADERSSSLGGDSDDGGPQSGRSRTSSAATAGEGSASSPLDLEVRGPPMLMGDWASASAPCYAVPVPPPGSLAAPSTVQVRAFVGLTSRRCGVLSPGEVVQVVETHMVSGATRLRFRGGWVTLLDKSRYNGTPLPLMEWTRKPPTKIASFRDPELLMTLSDKVRQERIAGQQQKRREREDLANAALADGAGGASGARTEDERATSASSEMAGRPLSGKSESMPNLVPPMVLTGLEPEKLGEALNRGNQLLGNAQLSSSAATGAQQVLAKLYAGEGGPADVRQFGTPRTPRSATTGAPAYRSYTFHIFSRASNRPIASFTHRYSSAKSTHEEMLAIGIDMTGCEFPSAHLLRDMVDDEENVARRAAKLERYYQALFGLHWSNGTPRSVELLKEMLGTELLLPAPERADQVVANRASMFFDQLEAMHKVFHSYTDRTKRETVAREDVVDLLAEMGVELPVELGVKDRTMDRLEDAGWERIEAWWQDPTERMARARAEAAGATADAAKAREREVSAAGVVTAQFDDVDDDEVAALERAAGVGRDSMGNQLMEMVGSFRETLREPVSGQLVRQKPLGGVDDDGDLSSELEMMQLTEEQRLERALGAGLAADAPWMAIAEAELAPVTSPRAIATIIGADKVATIISAAAARSANDGVGAEDSGGAAERLTTAGVEALASVATDRTIPAEPEPDAPVLLPEPSAESVDGPQPERADGTMPAELEPKDGSIPVVSEPEAARDIPGIHTVAGPEEEALLPARGDEEQVGGLGGRLDDVAALSPSPTDSTGSDGLDDSMDYHDVEEH